jgi:ABC-type transport system involved in multi-copper enzyme maturation permease subunit
MGIVLNLGILSSILSLLGIGRFLFTTNANLGIYFGITSSIPMGGNFFLALSLLLAYLAVMLAGTYIVFNKKDIA